MKDELNPAALDALKNNQRQLDMDGCEVGVSRQALNELIAAYETDAPLARSSTSQVAPANPAQVTDARYDSVALEAAREIMTLTRSGVFDDRLKAKIQVRITEAITAAIGAGGQAVAWLIESNCGGNTWVQLSPDVADADREFVDIIPLYAQPHPADERVVEALRKIEYCLTKDSLCEAEKIDDALKVVRRLIATKEGQKHG